MWRADGEAMHQFETIWSFKTENFRVTLSAMPEENPDLSWDDTGEAREKIEDGTWQCVCFRVRVLHRGEELGSSYLGESIYADLSDFRTEHIGLAIKSRADGRNYGAYFPGMVKEAIAEARNALRAMQSIKVRQAA